MVDPQVPEIDVDTLAQQRDVPLVDVREVDEYEEFHVPGAQLVPLSELTERVDEVPADGQVFIICRSGQRSHRAAEFLRARGVDAVNIAGGSLAWVEAGHEVATGPEPG
jgi:rhodanese-related sulfurtransferase